MRSRRRLLALLTTSAAAAAALPIAAMSAPGAALPDLRADPPEGAYLQVYGGDRLLLRFDGYVTNVGSGPLDVTGNPSQPGGMKQRVHLGDDRWQDVRTPEVRYETADGHNHWHLMRIMRYSLRRADSSAEVAPAQKVGFCLYDIEQARSPVARRDAQAYDGDGTFCDQGQPSSTALRMGVSAGWRDVYDSGLALQWVDVSSTAPGTYRLAAEADPYDVVEEEGSEVNAPSYATVNVAGHLAQPVGPVAVDAAPRQITLAATTVTNTARGYIPGSRVFRIESAPAHGRLSVPVGGTTTSGTVTYTPAPGYSGPDSFQFSVRDSRGFPRTPPAAAVTLDVRRAQAVAVAISGAPASLTAGTAAQLAATVTNGPADVVWSIDGDPGDGRLGTVSPGGLYTAPASPPAAPVVVRATSAADRSASATASIAITPVPVAVPAPLPAGGAQATQGGAAPRPSLTKPRVKRNGRTLVVRVAGRKAGTLNVAARRGGKRADQCVIRLGRARGVTCRLRVAPKFASKPLRVVVLLKGADGTRTLRTLVVRP